MSKDNFSQLIPLSNIFDQSAKNKPVWVPSVMLLLAIFLLLFYSGMLWLIPYILTLAFIIAIAYFLRNRKIDLQIQALNSYAFLKEKTIFSIHSDFRWDATVDEIRNNFSQINEALKSTESSFTIVTIPVQARENFKFSRSEYEESNVIFSSYLILDRDRRENDSFIKQMGVYGISIEKRNIDELYTYLDNIMAGNLQRRRNFVKGKTNFSMSTISQSFKRSHYQASRLLDSLPFSCIAVTNFILQKKSSDIIRKEISKILAKSRLRNERNLPEGDQNVLMRESALEIRNDSSEWLYSVQQSFVLSSKQSYKLKSMQDELSNMCESWGLSLSLPDHRKNNLMEKLFTGKFIRFLQTPNKLCAFFTFLTEVKEEGIIIGKDSQTDKPVHFDPFLKGSYNIIAMGETGSGKSFFSMLFLRRMVIEKRVKHIMILDVLNEYDPKTWEELCAENAVGIRILKIEEGEVVQAMEEAMGFLKSFDGEEKIIVIEEAHVFLNHSYASKVLAQMVKVSRHFRCCVFTISQDANDITSEEGKKILNNSNSVFIFRNKLMGALEKFGINISEFGYMKDQLSLHGGKNSQFSESFFYSNHKLRKIVISDSPRENEISY